MAEKLPETYDSAKSDACDTLRFFVENDIDQRSDSSSIDGGWENGFIFGRT